MQVLHKLSEMNMRHILKKIKQIMQGKEGTTMKKVRKFTTFNQQNVYTYSLDIYIANPHLICYIFLSVTDSHQGMKPK
jgi:hypothetical protein